MSLLTSLAGKFKDLLTQSPEIKALHGGLAPLDSLQPGLAERCCSFVVDSSNPEVLLTLAQFSEAGELLGSPGSSWVRLHSNPTQRKAAENSVAARCRFYQLTAISGPSAALTMRLGKVFEAADQKRDLLRADTAVPDWLYYLLVDGALRQHSGGWSLLEAAAKGQGPAQLPLSCALIEQLLIADERDPNITLQLLFERKGIESYRQSQFDPLLKLADVESFLLARAGLVGSLPAQLSAVGRVELAKCLARKSLATAFASVLTQLAVDSSKAVREVAAPALSLLPDEVVASQLQEMLSTAGSAGERVQAAELISRRLGEAALPVLRAAAETETSKPVLEAIHGALSRADAAASSAGTELPAPPPFKQIVDQPLGAEALALLQRNLAEMLEQSQRAVEVEARENEQNKRNWSYARQNLTALQKIGPADLQSALDRINGVSSAKTRRQSEIDSVVRFKERLVGLNDTQLPQLLGQIQNGGVELSRYFSFSNPTLSKWLDNQPPESLDLRSFAQAFERRKLPQRAIADACLCSDYRNIYPMDRIPAGGIWPFFAENLDWIREGLGMIPKKSERFQREFELSQTIRVLATFPVIPAEFIPRLLELALGEAKSHRQPAQELLCRLPDIGSRVLQACASSKQELRIVAIVWLSKLELESAGQSTYAPELRKMLAKEIKETVRAALLSALEQFGEDTSEWLSPARLQAEASKGLKAKLPADIGWFNFEALAAARWSDGQPVAAEILRWWVVLAAKLKSPAGNALLDRYLRLLDANSGAALGRTVLAQFIAQDTRCPSLEDGNAFAETHADQQLAMYKQWAKYTPEYANYTREKVFEMLRQGHMATYFGSAIGAKGILALITRVPGHELASTVSAFMRDHFMRRAQIEALLEAIAGSDDPAAMQLLMAVSRRHRTASVQAKALLLVDSCAQRLGWSAEQLADRTIPSGGLDESGALTLSYGARSFQVRLDEAMKAELRNEDGKLIKALPDPRKDEDAALVKESKGQFAACKKEIKQVIDLQSARLYEAMCAQRGWPVAEWQEYLHAHPIVGRLCQRLIWSLSSSDQEAPPTLFRPSEDGSLLNAQDDEVTLPADGQITLTHGALLDEPQRRAWKAHLKDYKIKPLFAQLDRLAPALDTKQDSEVTDRMGWCADTFTLRGAFNKLGYQRGQAEDGGCFFEYSKSFTSLGIKVIVEFSGNCLPEENVAAALKGLSFRRLDGSRYSYTALALEKVPPVLLAEAYADYLQVAASGTGFDPNWESKMPW